MKEVSQKLKYDTKTLKTIYNKNKTIEYVTSTEKNRRSINDHNKLKIDQFGKQIVMINLKILY